MNEGVRAHLAVAGARWPASVRERRRSQRPPGSEAASIVYRHFLNAGGRGLRLRAGGA